MEGRACPSQHWILAEGDRYFNEVAGFIRLEPGQKLMLGRDNEACQQLFAFSQRVKRRQLEIENDAGFIVLRKLDGDSDTFAHFIDDPQEVARPLSRRLDNIKQLRRIFGGPISLDPPEQANVAIQRVNEILRGDSFRPRDSSNRPGGLIELPDRLLPIIVGDLHARVDNLLKILSEGGFLSALCRGQACLVFLGDALHPEDDCDLQRMDTSLLILDLIFRLKITFPNNVFYLRGNHDSFDEQVSKAGVPQGILFQNHARRVRGRPYEAALAEFFELLPYVVRSRNFVACHAGPPRGERTLQDFIDIRMHPELAHELIWNRVRRPNRESGYTEKDVRAFKRALGVEADVPLIVGHTPLSADGTLWLDAAGIPSHHILYSAHSDKLAVFIRVNERMVPLVYPTEPLLDFTNALCVDENKDDPVLALRS